MPGNSLPHLFSFFLVLRRWKCQVFSCFAHWHQMSDTLSSMVYVEILHPCISAKDSPSFPGPHPLPPEFTDNLPPKVPFFAVTCVQICVGGAGGTTWCVPLTFTKGCNSSRGGMCFRHLPYCMLLASCVVPAQKAPCEYGAIGSRHLKYLGYSSRESFCWLLKYVEEPRAGVQRMGTLFQVCHLAECPGGSQPSMKRMRPTRSSGLTLEYNVTQMARE